VSALVRAVRDGLRDPGVRAGVVLVAVVALGFALLGFGWRGVARTPYVPFQVPWLLSAGVVGIALIGTALGALTIHVGRREAAAARAVTDEIVRTAIELADDVRTGRRRLPPR
jgi:hypothetical protein